MNRVLAALLGLSLAGCAATPAPLPSFTLSRVSNGRVVVAIAPPRALQAEARRWRGTDVFHYVVTLEALEPRTAEPPYTVTVARVPDAPTEAVFDALPTGTRYRVSVVAHGNAGGTAPDVVLNQVVPATTDLDLTAPAAPVRLALDVPLDATIFDGTLTLPTVAADPLPRWLTRMAATLTAPGGAAPVARASWAPTQAARFDHIRGDVPYRVDFTVTSAAGSRTMSLPDVTVPLAEGDATAHLPYPAIAPPTGTLLATHVLTSAFGVAVDASQRIWVTNQHHDTISVLNPDGTLAIPLIAAGNEPRGIAIDRADGTIWVANYLSGTIMKIVDDVVVATYSPGGFLFRPGGIAVDAQHRVWVTSTFDGRVRVLNPDGTAAAGSPYTVGAQPAGLAIDPGTGDVWVANSAGASISRIRNGVVAGPFTAAGMVKPGGIAVGPDHTVWVSDPRNAPGAVQRFNPDGTVLGAGLFAGVATTGLAVDQTSGVVWAAAQSGMQIFRYLGAGTTGGNWPAGTIGNQVAIDARGHVWVAGDGKLSEIAP